MLGQLLPNNTSMPPSIFDGYAQFYIYDHKLVRLDYSYPFDINLPDNRIITYNIYLLGQVTEIFVVSDKLQN